MFWNKRPHHYEAWHPHVVLCAYAALIVLPLIMGRWMFTLPAAGMGMMVGLILSRIIDGDWGVFITPAPGLTIAQTRRRQDWVFPIVFWSCIALGVFVATRYAVPTDDVIISALVGVVCGRLMMRFDTAG